MKLVFKSSPAPFRFPFRIIGDAGRYDTLSDCEFVSDTQIVCADRQMARLYLVEFDLEKGSHTILDSKECVVDTVPQHFELLHIKGNKVYSVSYSNTLFSCEIKDNKFCNFKTTKINEGEAYHGVCDGGTADSVFLTNMKKNNLTHYDTKSRVKTPFPCAGAIRMKDAAIIDDKHILAISSDKGPINGTLLKDGKVNPRNPPYDSHVHIFNRADHRLVRQHTFKDTQIDGCVVHDGYCYVTCARCDGTGYIWRAKLDADYNFTDVKELPAAGFPHGIAVRNKMLAYTSYTESALYIQPLEKYEA